MHLKHRLVLPELFFKSLFFFKDAEVVSILRQMDISRFLYEKVAVIVNLAIQKTSITLSSHLEQPRCFAFFWADPFTP